MNKLATALLNDENGFLISAELILISTIAVIGIVVGLSEISAAVNNELEDVAASIGSMNQSFYVSGKHSDGKGCTSGSSFSDEYDTCDSQWDIQGTSAQSEY